VEVMMVMVMSADGPCQILRVLQLIVLGSRRKIL
jgi:hypothetical protein